MPGFDTDPEVTGTQAEGESFDGRPVVSGARDDGGLVRAIRVDDSGRLKVIQASVVPPDGADPLSLSVPQADLSLSSSQDTDGPIVPSGSMVFCQFVLTGSELDGSGNRVDLLWVEGATEYLIEQFFVHGPSVGYPLFDVQSAQDGTLLEGNGTNTFLRIRRTRLSGGSKQVAFSLRGYTKA